MGNTDPNNTKAGKEYDVKPQPVNHHRSVVFRHNQSVGHHSDDSVVPFRHDTSVGRSQRGSISAVNKSSTRTSNSQYATSTDLTRHDYSTCPTASSLVTAHSRSYPEAKSKSSRELKNSRVWSCENVRATLLLHAPSLRHLKPPNWYQSKELLKTSSSPPVSLQTMVEIYRRRVRMNNNYRGFTGENDEKYRVQNTLSVEQNLASDLIHSTNGNHLERPNEGSSIDHQVTIHLHAQNITMFPTNETWYFASQMLVSSSGDPYPLLDNPID
ncbi:(E,E)-alpha-farnesene synthase-like [Dorcoceras hygrometricum]|uniref:(E,E)-alpha-farnesene synthase-like n=1 Tax=Dorcoceras hygrometricum TaxID=472368 RepID=A0A2Z7C8F2_9LAMI|nr:(E,E)-alpha-farnesene synthase-like [Dorcoceras hygrometricum]